MLSQADIAAYVKAVFVALEFDYVYQAGSALVVYEYFITLEREVELFWKGKWTGAAILFFFNRYLSLIVNLYGLVDHAPISAQGCSAEVKAINTFDFMQYLPWAVFSTLRALALTRSSLLAAFVFSLSIAPIPIDFYILATKLTGVIDPVFGLCGSLDSISIDLLRSTCLIAADVLLFCITWANLYKKGTLRLTMKLNGLVATFLRDGTIYFIVLGFISTFYLIEELARFESGPSQNIKYLMPLWEPMATILVSRFLLDLQSADRRTRGPQGTTSTLNHGGVGSLIFERVIGSIGSSFETPGEDEDMFDEDGDERCLHDGNPDETLAQA